MRLVSAMLWFVRAGVVLLSAWCVGAIWYQDGVTAAWAKAALMALFAVAVAAALILSVRRRRLLWVAAALPAGVCAAWLALYHPSRSDDWDAPFARLPKVTFSEDGKSFTIENVRDFHYRSETDYDVRYRTETYAFDDLETVDYSVTHWDGNEIFGHIILSFRFRDGRRLAFSPEARLRRGEKYELLPGLFRQYEIMFVFATEEDVLQLRTNHRKHEHSQVYLYPTTAVPHARRVAFRDLLARTQALRTDPEYYNVLTYNCLSSIAPSAEKVNVNFFSGWRGPVNGVSDRRAWNMGWLAGAKPDETFEDYRRRHLVNRYVENLVDPPNFSDLIRQTDATERVSPASGKNQPQRKEKEK